ncbi:NADH ubiquinone oxidoreductase subunit NDUFA12-domain-containing protein [Kockiozyma suomiensis]|uniref:NADH ubiquinone oxidoreductase subunit NDUFA12-domain-containing protein n=1 Tax=Kockiozyma suomiensis TaxID=1337062 RepID=UPI003343A9A0
MSTSLVRVIRNAYRVGFKDYLAQMMAIGDTKYGTLVGIDRFGNKFFENKEEDEIHLRTRWVQYKEKYYDVSQIEPGWHGWLGYLVDTPPNALDAAHTTVRKQPEVSRVHNGTGTRDAYVPYSTVKPKFESWTPQIKERV